MATYNAVVFGNVNGNQLTAIETMEGTVLQVGPYSYVLDSDEVQDLIQFLVDGSDAAFEEDSDGNA